MGGVKCHWGTLHSRDSADGLKLVCSVSSAATGEAHTTLFDTAIGAEAMRAGADNLALAAYRAAQRARADGAMPAPLAVGRGSSAAFGLVDCAALAVPLLEADGGVLGVLTVLCTDAARTFSADEQ
eukprot:1690426-Prymnesium_polylepis.1